MPLPAHCGIVLGLEQEVLLWAPRWTRCGHSPLREESPTQGPTCWETPAACAIRDSTSKVTGGQGLGRRRCGEGLLMGAEFPLGPMNVFGP